MIAARQRTGPLLDPLLGILLLGFLLLGALSPAVATASADDDKVPGLAIGKRAPSFQLKDQNGRNRSLDDLLKQGNVALVFYRSADW